MKVMIVCRSGHSPGSNPGAVTSMLRDCIRANTKASTWTLSSFSSGDGVDLYLLIGASAAAAAPLADAIRKCDIGLDVDLWQSLDSCDLVTALFP
ncbi:hypothetical protein [Agrobacterium rosae]|uniref:GYD domain-containing protein n=1 Tax=Agrobacterium rosae TaxID=1972867 RepID=A0AAW9FLI4_9HYPH|nr:hypothetical protein [Agrobacterium rosae]MDX8304447.1 hypothetical protein [Agrobacterium rosae]